MKEIKQKLEVLDFRVRSFGIARPEEIVFFYSKNQEQGFRCNSYKFEDGDIPDFAVLSPFLISVGPNWNTKGLVGVIKNYRNFFVRGIPIFDISMDDEKIINICRRCLILPWGNFPHTKEGEEKLVKWLRKIQPIFFPSEQKDIVKLASN